MRNITPKQITMADVAKAAGVSRALVSLAYRGLYGVSEETRERIFEKASELGYRHNRVAAQLASKSRSTIGIFLQDLRNDWFADVFDGLREVLEMEGRETLLAIGSVDGRRDQSSIQALQTNQVAAIIAVGLTLDDAGLAKVFGNTPLVSVARSIPGADNVLSDNFQGASLATQHLLDYGHRRICFLANPQTDGYRDRLAGYSHTMQLAGLAPMVEAASYSRTESQKLAIRVLGMKNRPTAIFAHNDQSALGVWDAAHEMGLAPGRDLSIVGYDNTQLSRMPETRLSTVDTHGTLLGEMAARAVIERLAKPGLPAIKWQLEPTLVVRESSGPVHTEN